jgi:hypothetical protein
MLVKYVCQRRIQHVPYTEILPSVPYNLNEIQWKLRNIFSALYIYIKYAVLWVIFIMYLYHTYEYWSDSCINFICESTSGAWNEKILWQQSYPSSALTIQNIRFRRNM